MSAAGARRFIGSRGNKLNRKLPPRTLKLAPTNRIAMSLKPLPLFRSVRHRYSACERNSGEGVADVKTAVKEHSCRDETGSTNARPTVNQSAAAASTAMVRLACQRRERFGRRGYSSIPNWERMKRDASVGAVRRLVGQAKFDRFAVLKQ